MKFPPIEFPDMTHVKAAKATAPWDSRFPNQNQSKHCYVSYVDFHRCKKLRGEEYSACQYFKKVYQHMCPSDWVERWDEQISENRFAGRI